MGEEKRRHHTGMRNYKFILSGLMHVFFDIHQNQDLHRNLQNMQIL